MPTHTAQLAALPSPHTASSSDTGTYPGVQVDLAISRVDRQRALELREEVYCRKGLVRERALQPRVSQQSCVTGSATFVAKQRDAVVGTISFYMDSEMGLPMDDVYCSEVDTMRERFARIAEVGGLAVLESRRDLGVITMLYQAAFRWAIATKTQCVVACVSPSSRRVYSKMLLFKVLGECKRLPRFQGVPSIPVALDVSTAVLCGEALGREASNRSHKTFGDLHLAKSYTALGAAEYRQWSGDEVSEMIKTRQLVLTEDARSYIERHYAIHGRPGHPEQGCSVAKMEPGCDVIGFSCTPK